MNPVQKNEIKKLINNVSLKKSAVPCSRLTKILRKLVDVLKQYLSFLVYLAFWQGLFLESVKPLSANIHHFVDEPNLIFPVKKLGTKESIIINELKHLVQCLRDTKFSIDEAKNKLIIFGSPLKQVATKPDIRLNNCKLKLHIHVEYLGIFIDEVLSWNKQTNIV